MYFFHIAIFLSVISLILYEELVLNDPKLFMNKFISKLKCHLIFLFGLNECSLSKQPLFWLGITLPIITASYLEYEILSESKTSLTIANLDEIFKLSSIPIYISAITPTLGIFISNIHRTIQTKKQIDTSNNQVKIALNQLQIAQTKNTQDGFYAHYKHITESFKNIVLIAKEDSIYSSLRTQKLFILRPHSLYKKIFSQSSISNGCIITISNEFEEKIIEKLNNISSEITKNRNDIFECFYKKQNQNIKKIIYDINREISSLLTYVFVSYNTVKFIEPAVNEKGDIKQSTTLYEIALGIKKTHDMVVSIIDISEISNEQLKEAVKRFRKTVNFYTSIRMDIRRKINTDENSNVE